MYATSESAIILNSVFNLFSILEKNCVHVHQNIRFQMDYHATYSGLLIMQL